MRVARPERRRQDDHGSDATWPDPPDLGLRDRCRNHDPGHPGGPRGAPPSGRAADRNPWDVRPPVGLGKSIAVRAALPNSSWRARIPDRTPPHQARALGAPGRPGGDLQQGNEAAPGNRPGRLPRAPGGVLRRADRRTRSRIGPGRQGVDWLAQGRRANGARVHPQPRRGRRIGGCGRGDPAAAGGIRSGGFVRRRCRSAMPDHLDDSGGAGPRRPRGTGLGWAGSGRWPPARRHGGRSRIGEV